MASYKARLDELKEYKRLTEQKVVQKVHSISAACLKDGILLSTAMNDLLINLRKGLL